MNRTQTRYLASFLMLGVALAVPSNALAQTDGVQLKWKFKAGDKLTVEFEQDVSTETTVSGRTAEASTTSSTWMNWEITDVNSKGIATVSTTIGRMKMEMDSPMGNVVVDTEGNQADGPNAEMVAKGMRPLIGHAFNQTMTSRGTVLDVQVPDEVVKSLSASGGPGSVEMLKNVTKNATLEFPEKPLSVGDNWKSKTSSRSPVGTVTVENTYTYQGVATVESREFHHFVVDVEMDFDTPTIEIVKQNTQGNLYFDAEAGRIDHSRVEQEIEMTISANGQSLTQKLNQIATVKFQPAK